MLRTWTPETPDLLARFLRRAGCRRRSVGGPGLARGARRAVAGGMFASVRTAKQGPFWRKLLAFLGPGYLVAVGYMDPGNWATSLAGGSKFGYALLRWRCCPT